MLSRSLLNVWLKSSTQTATYPIDRDRVKKSTNDEVYMEYCIFDPVTERPLQQAPRVTFTKSAFLTANSSMEIDPQSS